MYAVPSTHSTTRTIGWHGSEEPTNPATSATSWLPPLDRSETKCGIEIVATHGYCDIRDGLDTLVVAGGEDVELVCSKDPSLNPGDVPLLSLRLRPLPAGTLVLVYFDE
jgi:hypothetical protein